MGAEQSAILSGEPLPSVVDSTGPSSLPASPIRIPPSDSFQRPLQHAGRSLSLLVGQASESHLVNIEPAIMSPDCHTGVQNSQIYRSHSVCDGSAHGIVVVCPGPSNPSRKTNSFDSLFNRTRHDASGILLKRLERIPSFIPFIPCSTAPTKPQLLGSVACSDPKLTRPTSVHLSCSELCALIDTYHLHVRESTESVCKAQQRMLGLQNKVDYELKRLSDELRFREKGHILSPHRSSKTTMGGTDNSGEPSAKVAGRRQIDEFVLQSTQISGLIDQSRTLVKVLCNSLHQINLHLPQSERLPLPTELGKFISDFPDG